MTEENTCLFRRLTLACGNFFFRFRNGLFPLTFVVLFFLTRPALFLGNESLDLLAVAAGIAIAVAGQIFRLLVIGFAYIKRGGKEGRVWAEDLVVKGFYAHSRNPMYVGNFLITVGVGIIYGSPWIYFLVIPFFSFVYGSIVAVEENYLLGRFGAPYEDYMRRVNRFIPNFHGIQESLREFHYDWKRALRKDYGTMFGLMLGILFLNAWKAYYIFGFAERKRGILTCAVLLVPATAFYITTRILKLSKRLASS